jgi:hypothetical protein
MNRCSKYHVLISCLIDGELTSKERCELEEHFKKCDHCLARYNKYKQLSTIVDSIYTNHEVPCTVQTKTKTTGANYSLKEFFHVYGFPALPGIAALLLVILVTIFTKTTQSGNSPLVSEASSSLITIPLSTFSCFDSTAAENNQSRLSYIDNSYETEETGITTFPVYESPLFNDKLTEKINFYNSSQLFSE